MMTSPYLLAVMRAMTCSVVAPMLRSLLGGASFVKDVLVVSSLQTASSGTTFTGLGRDTVDLEGALLSLTAIVVSLE